MTQEKEFLFQQLAQILEVPAKVPTWKLVNIYSQKDLSTIETSLAGLHESVLIEPMVSVQFCKDQVLS